MSNTEAPTSGYTKTQLAAKNAEFGEVELSFVTFIDQWWHLKGEVMSLSTAVREFNFTEDEFTTLMSNPSVLLALSERGIISRDAIVDEDTPSWVMKYALSPKQLLAANLMLDLNDTRSVKKKLQDIEVSTGQYNAWLKDSVFSGYLREAAEKLFGANQHEALLALLDKVRMGDTKAIELYLEMTDRFTRQSATPASGANGSDAINFRNMLIKILEIINDEVKDPEAAANIADRLKSLVGATTLANELMSSVDDDPIVVPKIRELNS